MSVHQRENEEVKGLEERGSHHLSTGPLGLSRGQLSPVATRQHESDIRKTHTSKTKRRDHTSTNQKNVCFSVPGRSRYPLYMLGRSMLSAPVVGVGEKTVKMSVKTRFKTCSTWEVGNKIVICSCSGCTSAQASQNEHCGSSCHDGLMISR